MLRYQDYIGKVSFDSDAEIFHGEVINTRDVITFQGKTVDELKQAFTNSVDDYIDFCRLEGVEPERGFSGSLNLRLGADLHKMAFSVAKSQDQSLNTFIISAVKNEINHFQQLPPC